MRSCSDGFCFGACRAPICVVLLLGIKSGSKAPVAPRFWSALLSEYKIASVFDCTAGSGGLLEACMTQGTLYHGLCITKEHQGWLQAIADRAACGLVTLEGSTLFSDSLAMEVKKFFPDILTSLAPKSDAHEPSLEPDSPCDGGASIGSVAPRLLGPQAPRLWELARAASRFEREEPSFNCSQLHCSPGPSVHLGLCGSLALRLPFGLRIPGSSAAALSAPAKKSEILHSSLIFSGWSKCAPRLYINIYVYVYI